MVDVADEKKTIAEALIISGYQQVYNSRRERENTVTEAWSKCTDEKETGCWWWSYRIR